MQFSSILGAAAVVRRMPWRQRKILGGCGLWMLNNMESVCRDMNLIKFEIIANLLQLEQKVTIITIIEQHVSVPTSPLAFAWPFGPAK